MVIAFLERIGREVLKLIEGFGSVLMLGYETICQFKKPPKFKHVLEQMAHLGVDTLPIVTLTILFTGMVITLQTATEFIKFGAQSTVGGIVAIAMGRELAPVLTGVVAAGRVGATITAKSAQ